MYREFVTLSKCHVLYFSPAQEKLLRGLVVSHAQLNVASLASWTSGNSRSYPPVPCLRHGVKQLLTIMDFSFVYLPGSMLFLPSQMATV